MANSIAWTEEKRKLGDLLAWPKNPRQIDCFWRWMNFAGWIAVK